MAIFGCPNCRIRGETDTWPSLIVVPVVHVFDGRTAGHTRLVCRICAGPLQAVSKADLASDVYHATLDEQLRGEIPASFVDLVADQPALPPPVLQEDDLWPAN